MFITCQECNTTFRLDERLLKPTGSKVRCSQCLHTFVAMPQAAPPRPAEKQTVAVAPPAGPAAAATAEQAQELEGLDLAELDALLEGSEIRHDPPGNDIAAESGETDELDLDLDFDFDAALDPELANEAAPSDEVQTTVDELDLEMDFEIEEEPFTMGDQTEAAPVDADAAPVAGETLREASLEDDLELALEGLNLETEENRPPAPPPPKNRQTNDLDLADLDLDLDADADDRLSDVEEQELSLADEAAADHTPEAADLGLEASGNEPEPDPDLEDFDLEFEEAEESSEENDDIEPELELDDPPGKSADNLDLSDLDGILNDSGESVETAANEPELQLDDPDLHLDLEDRAALEEKNADAAESELDELDFDFELDGELDDSSVEPSLSLADEDDVLPEEDEIDLSDIEEMLGNGEEETKAVADRWDDEEFDLDGEGGEIDLSELESAIDQAEEASEGPSAKNEQELELELDLDATPSSQKDEIADDGVFTDDLKLELADGGNDGVADELDLELELEMENDDPAVKSAQPTDAAELDLSDLADLVDGGRREATPEVVDTGDIELEFHIEEEDEDEKAAAVATAAAAGVRHAVPIEETFESSTAKGKPAKAAKPVKPKKKSSKSLVFLLFLLLLAVAAYGVYYAVTQMGVTIPYVSDYLKPAPSDPSGSLNLTTLDINSKFIENSSSGRLFVITGKVRNGYSSPRRSIRLLGKLFTKGKVLVKSEYAYAGTVVADADLAGLPSADIKQRLNRNDAAALRPGQNTPFMIVFSDLPPAEQLDEFAVELVSSAPVTR